MNRTRILDWTYGMLWGILLLLYVLPPLAHLDSPAWNYDEGPQLQTAALANQGYKLYSNIVLNKPPLLTWLLQLTFKLSGPNLISARITMLIISLLGFIALGTLAIQWWGKWAGPLTMAAFLALPTVPVRASAIMNDLPVMTTALLALNAATRYRYTQRRRWLSLSGLAYAAVLLLHPMLFFLIIPIGLILVMPEQGPLRLFPIPWRAALHFGLWTLIAILPWLLTTDQAAALKWILQYNSAPVNPQLIPYYDQSWTRLWAYLSPNYAFLILALLSLLLLGHSQKHRFWISLLLLWFALTFMILWTRRPMWNHYPLLLMYPLVLAIGGGLAATEKAITQWAHAPSRWQRGIAILSLCGILLLINNRLKQNIPWPKQSDAPKSAYAQLRQQIESHEFIISDDQFATFRAGYFVPPSLADTSLKRIATGYLRAGEVMNAIVTQDVRMILFTSGRFAKIPHLNTWLATTAKTVPTCFDRACIYTLPKIQPSNNTLNGQIRLKGYQLNPPPPLHAGGTLTLTLYWESLAPIAHDLSVFVHLVDVTGTMWAQHDGAPFMGQHPTHTWRPGDTIPDPRPLQLPSDLPPGHYQIHVGMYYWPSLERLPATDAHNTRWLNDSIILTTLNVENP